MADEDAPVAFPDLLLDAIGAELADPGKLKSVAAGLVAHAAEGSVPAVNALLAALTAIARREAATPHEQFDLPNHIVRLMEALVPIDSGKVAGDLVARGVVLQPRADRHTSTALSRLVTRLADLGLSPCDALGWRWGKTGLVEVDTRYFVEMVPGGARECVTGGEPDGVVAALAALAAPTKPRRARRP